MSTKATVFFDKPSVTHLYEECMCPGDESPAYIQIDGENYSFHKETGQSQPTVTLEIDAEVMDKLAVAWYKHRNLHGELGGPVGAEFGGPDCPYD